MKSGMYLLILNVGMGVFVEESQATQQTTVSENTLIPIILEKMEKNDCLLPQEEKIFEKAVLEIQTKLKEADNKLTALSAEEQRVRNQNIINHITPTIPEILDKGKQYPWGIDLKLLEERGTELRTNNIARGGADLSSVVTVFQKVKDIDDSKPGKQKDYNNGIKGIMRVTKLPKEVIEKIPSLKVWGEIKAGKLSPQGTPLWKKGTRVSPEATQGGRKRSEGGAPPPLARQKSETN